MYDQFRWTNVSARRNRLTMEYEPIQPFLLIALAEAAAARTFLDVGANIGAYSLFATNISMIARIIAFEANPEAASELRANIVLNNLGDTIEVIEKAVSDTSAAVTFGIVSKFSGANSVVDTSIHSKTGFHVELKVEAVTLDELFSSAAEGPFCIKIDVEGHEPNVIRGARAFLSESKAVIQIEAYPGGKNETERQLEEFGFFHLTAIGPDHYYSNIESLGDAAAMLRIFERAVTDLIAYNHRNKAVLLKRGDFALHLTGQTAAVARRWAQRLVGKHL